MKKKRLLNSFGLFLFILITPLFISAQKIEGIRKSVFIAGHFDNATKILVRKFSKYYLTQTLRCFTDYYPEVINREFGIELSEIDAPTYVSIHYFSPGKINSTLIGTFLAEPGDSIVIRSEGEKVLFTGKSAASFQCQYEMNILTDSAEYKFVRHKKETIYEKLEDTLLLYDSLLSKKISVLNSYRTQLGNSVYAILSSDCIYEKSFIEAKLMRDYLQFYGKQISKKQEVIRFYDDHFKNQKVDTRDIPALFYSKNYTEFLYWKTRLDSWIKVNQYDSIPKLTVMEMYREINARYKGKLKEKLLTVFFSQQLFFTDSLCLLAKKILPVIKDPVLHRIMEEIQRKNKGTPAFNFSLQDSTGKIFHLTDFKGKVIVLDFWYTGCHWCTVMAKMIKPIAHEKDTSVRFITISIDENKNIWKKSLQGQNYSSEDELNLYTNGMGSEHSLIKYYGISTYPSIFIIDPKGRISAINPVTESNSPVDSSRFRQAISAAKREIM